MSNTLRNSNFSKNIFYENENETLKYYVSEMSISNNSNEVFLLKELNPCKDDKNISFFGVFEGHNGNEVSQYLSLNFSKFLLENKNFKEKKYKEALKETFINLDDSLRAIEVQQELKKYSKKNEHNLERDGKISKFLEIFDPRNLEGINIAEFSGSCGIIILITDENIYISNSGNLKYIPINKKNEIIKDKIVQEHSLENQNEIKRLKLYYGNEVEHLLKNYPLQYTRGFGDLQYKDNKLINREEQMICIIPDIIEIPKDDIKYLIIGNHDALYGNNESFSEYILDKIDHCTNIKEAIEIFRKSKVQNNEKDNINNISLIIIEFKRNN